MSPDRMELFDLVFTAMARRSVQAATGGVIRLAGHGPATGQMRTGSAPRVKPRLCVPRQQRSTSQGQRPLILASGYNSGRLGNYLDPTALKSVFVDARLSLGHSPDNERGDTVRDHVRSATAVARSGTCHAAGPCCTMSLGAAIVVFSSLASGVMIVMLLTLPETRGRSLESLEPGAADAAAAPRIALDPRVTAR
jgi:hypothetical protein